MTICNMWPKAAVLLLPCALGACAANKNINVINSSSEDATVARFEDKRFGPSEFKRETIAPGESTSHRVAWARSFGVSVPMVSIPLWSESSSGSHVEVDHGSYELPDFYMEHVRSWQDDGWLAQVLRSQAGELRLLDGGVATLSYRGRTEQLKHQSWREPSDR